MKRKMAISSTININSNISRKRVGLNFSQQKMKIQRKIFHLHKLTIRTRISHNFHCRISRIKINLAIWMNLKGCSLLFKKG